MSEDRAWRVRWCLIHKLYDLGKVILSLPITTTHGTGTAPVLISVEPDNYTNIQITIVNSLEVIAEGLLNDSEPEVRSAAAGNAYQYCKLFRKHRILSTIIPSIQKLCSDSTSEYVRTSMASSMNELSVIIGMYNMYL